MRRSDGVEGIPLPRGLLACYPRNEWALVEGDVNFTLRHSLVNRGYGFCVGGKEGHAAVWRMSRCWTDSSWRNPVPVYGDGIYISGARGYER